MFVHHCYYGNHHHHRHHLKSWPWKRRRMRWRAINFPELDPLLLLWLPSPIYVVLMVTTMLVGVRHIFLVTLLFGAGVCKWNSINMNRHTISTIKIIRSFLKDSMCIKHQKTGQNCWKPCYHQSQTIFLLYSNKEGLQNVWNPCCCGISLLANVNISGDWGVINHGLYYSKD